MAISFLLHVQSNLVRKRSSLSSDDIPASVYACAHGDARYS